MPRRRLILALLLGVGATLFFACAAPHLWFLAFQPAWTRGAVPGIPPNAPNSGVLLQTRPFVDLYEVFPATYRDSAAQTPTPRPPTAVRTDFDPAVFVRVDTALAGWPLRAMASEAWIPYAGPVEFRSNLHLTDAAAGPILIPLRPLPLNFLADAALFTLPAYALLSLPLLRPSWWAAGRRLRRGRCPACSYDLNWNLAPGCPECGWRRRSMGVQPVSPASPAPSGGGGRGSARPEGEVESHDTPGPRT